MSSNKAHLKQHFVIHDSNSMAPKWYSDNDLGRMKDVASVIQTVVPECLKSDADGIDINFVNSDVAMTNIQTPAKVGALINSVKPEGFTPIDKRLKTLVDDYWNNFDRESTHPKNFIIIGDGQAIRENEAANPYPLIETILGCCLEALRKDVDPQTVTFVFLLVGHPSKLGNPYNEEEKDEIERYADCCNIAAFALDKLKGKYLDLLRKKIVDEPKLKEYATEIENSSEKSPGRFDIVNMGGKWIDLTKDVVLEAMKGARDKS